MRPSHFSRPPSRPSVPVSKSWKKGKDPASERRPCLPLVSSCPLPFLPLGKGKFCTGQGERAPFKRPPGKGEKKLPLKNGQQRGRDERQFSAAARPHPFSSRSVKVDDGWGVEGGWKGANMQPTHTPRFPSQSLNHHHQATAKSAERFDKLCGLKVVLRLIVESLSKYY